MEDVEKEEDKTERALDYVTEEGLVTQSAVIDTLRAIDWALEGVLEIMKSHKPFPSQEEQRILDELDGERHYMDALNDPELARQDEELLDVPMNETSNEEARLRSMMRVLHRQDLEIDSTLRRGKSTLNLDREALDSQCKSNEATTLDLTSPAKDRAEALATQPGGADLQTIPKKVKPNDEAKDGVKVETKKPKAAPEASAAGRVSQETAAADTNRGKTPPTETKETSKKVKEVAVKPAPKKKQKAKAKASPKKAKAKASPKKGKTGASAKEAKASPKKVKAKASAKEARASPKQSNEVSKTEGGEPETKENETMSKSEASKKLHSASWIAFFYFQVQASFFFNYLRFTRQRGMKQKLQGLIQQHVERKQQPRGRRNLPMIFSLYNDR